MRKIFDVAKTWYIKIGEYNSRKRYKKDFKYFSHHHTDIFNVMNCDDEDILFLVPHADDDLFGGYALANRYKDKFVYGYFGLTGSNKEPENKDKRDQEFKLFCQRIHAQYTLMNDIKNLIELIRNKNTLHIFVPSIIDWHPEHRLLNYYLLDSLMEIKDCDIRISWYSVTVPICFRNAEIIPMDIEEQQKKYRLFEEVYISQKHMPIQRFILQERINVLGTEFYAGEIFLDLDLSVWKRAVEYVRRQENDSGMVHEFNGLSSKINNLKEIRALSRKYYDGLLEDEETYTDGSR